MIENGKHVEIHYTLKVDGNVVRSTEGTEPMECIHGKGEIFPSLERVLGGMNVRDTRDVTIGPDDAFGPIDPTAYQEIPKDRLPEGRHRGWNDF